MLKSSGSLVPRDSAVAEQLSIAGGLGNKNCATLPVIYASGVYPRNVRTEGAALCCWYISSSVVTAVLLDLGQDHFQVIHRGARD